MGTSIIIIGDHPLPLPGSPTVHHPAPLVVNGPTRIRWEDTMKITHRGCARIGVRAVVAGAVLMAAMASATAQTTDPVRLRFKGGIGVIPVSSGVLDNGAATTALVAP